MFFVLCILSSCVLLPIWLPSAYVQCSRPKTRFSYCFKCRVTIRYTSVDVTFLLTNIRQTGVLFFPLLIWTTSLGLFHPTDRNSASIPVFCNCSPLATVHLYPFEISLGIAYVNCELSTYICNGLTGRLPYKFTFNSSETHFGRRRH